jgi:eukaryotic-like serine/threonine-protein kinase
VTAGTVLAGRYKLDGQLAAGGMAQVWLGTDEVLRRSVAVKILHPHLAADEKFIARFRQEAIAVARLSHPAIVNVYDTCNNDGVEAIVMELVRGETLRQRMDSGEIGPWVAANIAAQVAGALDVAHAAGLVHRDIKPANIMLSEDGRVKVGDFGIAKAAESADLTNEGSFIGTAKYLAPEQVEAKPLDGRSDLYSLGVVLYEMLCGRVPFEADGSSATALARLHQDPARPRLIKPGIPRELEAITLRLLARDPDHRYSSAVEARAALLGAGAHDGPVATNTPTAGTPQVTAPSRPVTQGTPSSAVGGYPPPPLPPDQGPVGFARAERRWLVPTLLIVLVAVSLAVAALLINRNSNAEDAGEDGNSTTSLANAQPVGIASGTGFDPAGDGGEHNEDAALAFDGDPVTAWETEEYHNTPDFAGDGALKPGVGLYVELGEESTIAGVEITSNESTNWAVDIYVAGQPSDDLEGWGSVVGSLDGGGTGANSVEVQGAPTGNYVLLWFTRLGESPNDSGRYFLDVAEVQILGG